MALTRTNHRGAGGPRSRNPIRRRAKLAALTCTTLAAALLPAIDGPAYADQPPPASAGHANGQLFTAPGTALGKDWKGSSDVSVTGTGDSTGFHILRADESASFTYREVADLTEAGFEDIGPWTGYVCTTASGRYAAAVYAPSVAANKPELLQHGAFSAVVDLTTGKVTKSVTGVQLAYFSPGCGSTDTVAFTRSNVGDDGRGDTTVFDVDAGTGKLLRTTKVAGQFTNPLPTAGGDIGELHGHLVEVAPSGRTTVVTDLPGPLFALAPSTGGAVDVATVEGGKDVLHRWNGTGKTLATLGTAPLGSLALFPQSHGDLVAGDVAGIDTGKAPGLAKAHAPVKPVAASRQGHLLTTAVASRQLRGLASKIGAVTDEAGAGDIQLTALATATGTSATTDVMTASAATATTGTGPDDTEPTDVDGHTEAEQLGGFGVALADPNPGTHYPTCLVNRNDVEDQALQPSANMVEWATDQAVHGNLTVSRPSNYLAAGEPAYTPQGLFPKIGLTGGGTVPAQVMLGILAQESNFKQASWHAVPGDGGNPLTGDYYGNADSIHYYPNFGTSDCGYGVAQVTSGMSHIKGTPFTAQKADAVATDYAANIAAGLQILSQTWNQLASLNMKVNSGNPKYVENWFMALWGYNSGVYTDGSLNNGHVGLGWLNNPANANYPADRKPFLRGSYADASTPGNWSYEEKVMGWAETPQLTYNAQPSYSPPAFASATGFFNLNLNGNRNAYCTSANSCTPNQTPDPCPSENDYCWYHGSVSWMTDSDTTASREALSYALGSAEPALNRQYPIGPCDSVPGSSGVTTLLIDDLPDPKENIFGCRESHVDGGKFDLQLGDNFAYNRADGTQRATGDIVPIDFHQIGGGYDGHFWFTHAYAPTDSNYLWHKVTAVWTPEPGHLPPPNSPRQNYDVYVHLPNHGAQAVVHYVIDPGPNDVSGETTHYCNVNQATRSAGKDTWLDIGSVPLSRGATLTADNTTYHNGGSDGTLDAAFDAVAFVPVSQPKSGLCWDY